MRRLLDTLLDHDLGHLRIIAEFWGVDLPTGSTRQAAEALAARMLDGTALQDLIDSLPAPADQSLKHLLEEGGRIPAADFQRQYGPFREMGPGRRDREKPWRQPVSAFEILWYRGLIGRAFSDTPGGPQEFIFLARDFQELLPQTPGEVPQRLGVESAKPAVQVRATSAAVDDTTTLLAALRNDPLHTANSWEARRKSIDRYLRQPASSALLLILLAEAGILQEQPITPDPVRARDFLDLPRQEVMRSLLTAWRDSRNWNDLAHTPGLVNEADRWPNDPLHTRRNVLDFLHPLPLQTWWDLDALCESIHQRHASFQRPAGDFESWYLRRRSDGQYLQGFEYWDEVEGALLRFMLSGPLHWLGAIDLGKIDSNGSIVAFRLTDFAKTFRDADAELPHFEETVSVRLEPDGSLNAPFGVPRAKRYQLARFCAWRELDQDGYHYRLTPGALARVSKQGLEVQHVAALLEAASDKPIPASIKTALHRWEARGAEAELHDQLLLVVHDPEVMHELQADRRTSRYILEQLNSTHALVKRDQWLHFSRAAARLGLLVDPPKQFEM
jgi:hypothetical protein